LREATLHPPLPFTKGVPVLRIPTAHPPVIDRIDPLMDTVLYDLVADPAQEHPIDDPAVERRMIALLVRLMRENDAPPEQFERLGLPAPA
jgi:hypothetical protein